MQVNIDIHHSNHFFLHSGVLGFFSKLKFNFLSNYQMEDTVKKFIISGQEDSLEKLLSRLKFISKIKRGEKLDIKSMTIVKSNIPSRAYRSIISRETRIETLNFIKGTINTAIDLLYYYICIENQFDQKIAQVIITNLLSAKNGITNLIITYNDDRKFVTDLETTIETMDIKINEKKKE